LAQTGAQHSHQINSQSSPYSRGPSPLPLDNWTSCSAPRAEYYITPASLDEAPQETHLYQDENTQPTKA
jgi:hypothetical protein